MGDGGASQSDWSGSGLRLRQATVADADQIRDLVRDAYACWIPALGREPLPMLADYARSLTEHRFDVVETFSEVVGVIETMSRDDHLWIENVAIRPERQGQGLGRRLLAHAEGLATAEGLRELRLLTSSVFRSNIELYERVGYAITRTEPFMGGTTVHMTKHLT